ncbi:MAG: DUF3159 domain-containing protein [Actinomycetaceae bacterium]|nr:DUF3159 domain-containing protein [Actinomycetaceae bacterium]
MSVDIKSVETTHDDVARVPEQTKRSGLAAINDDDFNILTVVGGWRAVIETVLPTLTFVIGLITTGDYLIPAFAALILVTTFAITRIMQGKSVKPAIISVVTMAASVYVAWKTGQAVNVFLISILKNATYGSVVLLSILVRWPVLGVMLGLIRGEKTAWRKGEEWKLTRVRYYQITTVWLFVFIARLSVQVPLYFHGYAEWLGIAKLTLGLPTDILAAYLSWLLIRSLPKRKNSRI